MYGGSALTESLFEGECNFWPLRILGRSHIELIIFAFMYFSCVGLVFLCVGLVFGVPGLVIWGFGLVLGVCLLSGVCLLLGVCLLSGVYMYYNFRPCFAWPRFYTNLINN